MALGPTQPPTERVPGILSVGVKRPGREADHSPTSSADVKECVMALCLVKHRDSFTFTTLKCLKRLGGAKLNNQTDFETSSSVRTRKPMFLPVSVREKVTWQYGAVYSIVTQQYSAYIDTYIVGSAAWTQAITEHNWNVWHCMSLQQVIARYLGARLRIQISFRSVILEKKGTKCDSHINIVYLASITPSRRPKVSSTSEHS
jgi:hypothetical protein